MLLENLSYPEVEAYLLEKDIILIPIGSVEQHSPYGIIGTDFITAEAIAREAAEPLEVLVAPTFCYGASAHHMAFKGTVPLAPATLMAVVCEIVRALVAHGFQRLLFINGHGGNIKPVETAFGQLKSQDVAGYFEVVSWYRLEPVRECCRNLFGDKEGHHATPSEVSVTRHLRPEVFPAKATTARKVERPKYYWPLSAEEMKKVFPDGRMESAPWLASGESGRKVLHVAAAALREKIGEVMSLPVL